MWRGHKAVVPKLAKNVDVPRVHAEYVMAAGRIAYYRRKMMEIRARICDEVHVFVERHAAAGYARPATAAPAVDQDTANGIRRRLDANPRPPAKGFTGKKAWINWKNLRKKIVGENLSSRPQKIRFTNTNIFAIFVHKRVLNLFLS